MIRPVELTLIYRIAATLVSWMVRARALRARQEIVILLLRHRLAVLQRLTHRPRMRWTDRAITAVLGQPLPDQRNGTSAAARAARPGRDRPLPRS